MSNPGKGATWLRRGNARTLISKSADGDFVARYGWRARKDFNRQSSGNAARHCGVSAAFVACYHRGNRSHRWIPPEAEVNCHHSVLHTKNSVGENARSQAAAPLQ